MAALRGGSALKQVTIESCEGCLLGRLLSLISAQCSECESEEIQPSAGKRRSDYDSVEYEYRRRMRRLSILLNWKVSSKRCQKSHNRCNWLVAAKRPERRCFLILRCRLFLSLQSIICQTLNCSPNNREHESGLDRRETANAPLDGLAKLLKGSLVAKAGLLGATSGRKITGERLDYWSRRIPLPGAKGASEAGVSDVLFGSEQLKRPECRCERGGGEEWIV
ncbi:unnamed protein product [Toxocara canis]|uniref:Uncharacterized protein n=1 Tax=Toxocara canis TaxID=6265 RepID=A0A183U365_TOXCA|nr:unnamed protein product [Toxocara canis]